MNHLMEQIKETFEHEDGIIEDTGGIDTELLESELRLRTGLFVGRVHLRERVQHAVLHAYGRCRLHSDG